jgi:murein L,D-transpeptidase YafK
MPNKVAVSGCVKHTLAMEQVSRKRKFWSVVGAVALTVAAGFYAVLPAGAPPDGRADKIIVLKSQRQLLLMRHGQLLKGYKVALGREPVGPKVRTRDHRTPEGNYIIDWRNPQSKFHLSLHVSYPYAADVQRAWQSGNAPGGEIMIHGLQNGLGWIGRFHRLVGWKDGCIAVTNSEMDQIWRAVPDGTSRNTSVAPSRKRCS